MAVVLVSLVGAGCGRQDADSKAPGAVGVPVAKATTVPPADAPAPQPLPADDAAMSTPAELSADAPSAADIAAADAEIDAQIPEAAKVKGPDRSVTPERLATLSMAELTAQRAEAEAAIVADTARLAELEASLQAPPVSTNTTAALDRVQAAKLRVVIRERMRERVILDHAIGARANGEVQP